MAIANYTAFLTLLSTYMPVPATDANFTTVLPQIIDGAEQRLYRELDLLNTQVTATAALSTSTRQFSLPSTNGTFVVVDAIYAISPSTQTSPDAGTRNYLTPVSRQFLDATFPSSTGSTIPQYFAMRTQTTVIVGPWPDATYTIEIVGTIRPTPLSASNASTLLTQYFPDLFFAAAMVEASAYMRDFGAASDDPRASQNWEAHYQALMQSAAVEEARKKFTMAGWSSKQPAGFADPKRT